MRRTVIILLFALFFVFVLVLDIASLKSDAFAQSQPSEVVNLICMGDFWVSPPSFSVVASSSSAGAPPIPLGTTCAQALANLLNADFKIKDVQGGGGPIWALYILIKHAP